MTKFANLKCPICGSVRQVEYEMYLLSLMFSNPKIFCLKNDCSHSEPLKLISLSMEGSA